MTEKLTPEQLKAVFDLSDASDVTMDDKNAAKAVAHFSCAATTIRLLKHYHPELFVDPRLEAAKKLARKILAEENARRGWLTESHEFLGGLNDDTAEMKAVVRALLTDIRVGEN